jgi:hypothetical protein
MCFLPSGQGMKNNEIFLPFAFYLFSFKYYGKYFVSFDVQTHLY